MNAPQHETPQLSPCTRLHRLVGWCTQGSIIAAELELADWAREPSCPPEAQLLLAACLVQRQETDAALKLLRTIHADQSLYPEALKLMVALLIQEDLPEAARVIAERLFNAEGHHEQTHAWFQAVQPHGCRDLPRIPERSVEQLAGELMNKPLVIPTLVAAQKLKPEVSHIALLRPALERLAEGQSRPREALTLCLALAELALLAGDHEDATRWAYRGLRIDPYHAPLALVVAQLEDLHGAEGSATQVLEQAVEAHPTYPDLRAAMIRRTRRDGQEEQARLKLKNWLNHEPQHPMALKLQQELAA